MEKKNLFDSVKDMIAEAGINETEKNQMFKNLMKLSEQKVNIMITGATGCGKSSTINALFNAEVAKVGVGVDPETMDIKKYELDHLVLWDSPGLGDGTEADRRHSDGIIKKLEELDSDGNLLIDLVLVILDGGSRDLGTSYALINDVIIPHLGKEKEDRILVAINQADVAMKGRYWNAEKNEPEQKLIDFLEDKVRSVKDRIYQATHVAVDPIYYSAGYKEEGGEQSKPYNLSKLLYYIVKRTPSKKRAAYINNINKDKKVWKHDDKKDNYNAKTQKCLIDSVIEGASKGAEVGGKYFGLPGTIVGGIVGGILGAIFG